MLYQLDLEGEKTLTQDFDGDDNIYYFEKNLKAGHTYSWSVDCTNPDGNVAKGDVW